MNRSKPDLGAQNGAVLAICLILLLVMTIVGVAAMNGARLEISMAALMQKEELALRRAERTLMDAEQDVRTRVATAGLFEFGAAGDEYYINSDELNARKADWAPISHHTHPLEYTADGIDNDDFYVIEYLGEKVVPGGGQGVANDNPVAGSKVHTYRITTRSASGAKSIRIIESIYTTFGAP